MILNFARSAISCSILSLLSATASAQVHHGPVVKQDPSAFSRPAPQGHVAVPLQAPGCPTSKSDLTMKLSQPKTNMLAQPNSKSALSQSLQARKIRGCGWLGPQPGG
jgi:hypothetical protein